MTRLVRFGSATIQYQLIPGKRRNLVLAVHPDLSVRVRAPQGAPPAVVDERIRAHGRWILRQQRRFREYHPLPTPRRFESGETHLYLGRGYRLRIRSGGEEVRISASYLEVKVPRGTSRKRVEFLVRQWYRERARAVFLRQVSGVLGRAQWLRVGELRIRVASMANRWGSHGSLGIITLNVDLVKAPIACIEYVIAHELCHRLEPKHSRRFYRLLRRVCPDWERLQNRLNHCVR